MGSYSFRIIGGHDDADIATPAGNENLNLFLMFHGIQNGYAIPHEDILMQTEETIFEQYLLKVRFGDFAYFTVPCKTNNYIYPHRHV